MPGNVLLIIDGGYLVACTKDLASYDVEFLFQYLAETVMIPNVLFIFYFLILFF